MTRHNRPLTAVLLAAAVLASGLFAAGAQGNAETQAFLDLMENYLGLSERWVAMASQEETTVFLAVEGIIEIYEGRGEKAKAIPHLQRIVEQNPDNQAIRNVVRLKLRDLYNETGRSDMALQELDQIIAENAR